MHEVRAAVGSRVGHTAPQDERGTPRPKETPVNLVSFSGFVDSKVARTILMLTITVTQVTTPVLDLLTRGRGVQATVQGRIGHDLTS